MSVLMQQGRDVMRSAVDHSRAGEAEQMSVAHAAPAAGAIAYEDAIRELQSDPRTAQLIADCYIDADVRVVAERFAASDEWRAVRAILGDAIRGSTTLDLGAGNGVASYAFAQAGAGRVLAVEPFAGGLAGRTAIARLAHPSIVLIDSTGEALPVPDASVDIVYARQVLHHADDLDAMLAECARVLRPNGLFLACREHVVDDEAQLAAFLAAHPIHQLVGGEGAFPLKTYKRAISGSGLVLKRVWGPWDSIVNAFPSARTTAEFASRPRELLASRLGPLGQYLGRIPGATLAIRWRLSGRREPGRLYSFLAQKQ